MARLVRSIRNRPILRRSFIVSWTLLWVVILVFGVEILSRYWLLPWHQELGNRQMQPYFMSGGFYAAPGPLARRSTLFVPPSGPQEYGYDDKGDVQVYGFDNEISSIADRGDFLFQDRVQLANEAHRKDVIRVFVLGGSAAYGIGASSNEMRWYAVLEQALSVGLARQVRVIPAAMIGYVSTQERLALDFMVLPRKPDAVIVLDGFNDAVLPAIFGSRPGDPYDQGILYESFYSPLFGVKKWLASNSHFYRYLLHRSMAKAMAENRKRILEEPQVLSNYAQSTASVYLDNVRNMMERCGNQGVPCLFFLQPVRDLTWRYRGNQKPSDPITLAAYDQILQRSQNMAPGNSIHDLTTVFNGPEAERVFLDNVHFDDAGHQRIAEAMLPVVLDAIRDKDRR